MLGRAVGVLATSALGASAFLIPAGVAPPPKTGNAPPWALELQAENRLVRLPCSACAFSSQEEKVEGVEDDLFRIQGGANDVLLNYTVAADGETLLLNDGPIFRMGDGAILAGETFYYVDQVPASASLAAILDGEVKSTRVEVTAAGVGVTQETELKNGDRLVQLRSAVIELSEVPVDFGPVLLDLVQPSEGRLMILDIQIEERPQSHLPPPPFPKDFFGPGKDIEEVEEVSDETDEFIPPHPHRPHFEDEEDHESHRPHGPPDCKSLPPPICKLKHMIASKIHGMRKGGCPGRKPNGLPFKGMLPTHIRPPPFPRPHVEEIAVPFEDHAYEARPHHVRPYGGHHHHGPPHGHRFFHAFARGVVAVLIPTMVGIAVGVTVSIIGMVVGRLVAFLWFRVVRGGRRAYASVALEDDAVVEEAAKGEFEAEEEKEALPVYEDAPAYEEVEKGEGL